VPSDPIVLSIAPELAGRVLLGLLALDGVSVREADHVLAAEVEAECSGLRARYGGGRSAEVPGAADARTLYKALGLDPTKIRPSNEALLRRALKGEPIYRNNTLVDALNLCSLRHQLPYGLYDRAHVRPPIALRRGGPGESYEGIRKGPVSVDGRPVLADGAGPFGNPTSDSARTMITLATTEALVIAYAPAAYSRARLEGVMSATAETLVRHCGGSVGERRLIHGDEERRKP
jgi:DNA/RNA-binding domain of Phe-tRNA-synthetase-like protein